MELISNSKGVLYNQKTRYFECNFSKGERVYAFSERVLFFLKELQRENLSKDEIVYIVNRNQVKCDLKLYDDFIAYLSDYKNRLVLKEALESEIDNVKSKLNGWERQDFPPKPLQKETYDFEIGKILADFPELRSRITIDQVLFEYDESDINIKTNRDKLRMNGIGAIAEVEKVMKQETHVNKTNFFLVTRKMPDGFLVHTFLLMRVGKDLFEFDYSGQARRNIGSSRKDGSSVEMNDAINIGMFDEFFKKNPEYKLYLNMNEYEADFMSCGAVSFGILRIICLQMQKALSEKRSIDDVAKYYKDMRDIAMTENIFHEGVLDVMKTHCLDGIRVLTDSAKTKLEEIDKNKALSKETKNAAVREIMDNEESFKRVKSDFNMEKREYFYDPSILSFAQLERPITDAIVVSKKLEEAQAFDLIASRSCDGKLVHSPFVELRKKYRGPSTILSKKINGSLEEKEIESSNQLLTWRALILKDSFESGKDGSFVESLGTPSGSPEKSLLNFKQ